MTAWQDNEGSPPADGAVPTNLFAVWSLILGAVSFAGIVAFAFLAIPLGISAVNQVAASGGGQKGKGLGYAGVLLSAASLVVYLVLVLADAV